MKKTRHVTQLISMFFLDVSDILLQFQQNADEVFQLFSTTKFSVLKKN